MARKKDQEKVGTEMGDIARFLEGWHPGEPTAWGPCAEWYIRTGDERAKEAMLRAKLPSEEFQVAFLYGY